MQSADSAPTPTIFRRLWMVVLLTCLVITFPIALGLLASGPVYKQTPEGYQAITGGARWTWAGFLALWLVALITKAAVHPGEWQANTPTPSTARAPAEQATASNAAPTDQTATAVTTSDSAVPACSDPKVRQMALDGMQVAFDKMGMPFEPTMKAALGNLEEKDSDEAARLKRILTNPTDNHFKPDEVRMCQGAGPELDYLGLTAVIAHDGKLGGYVLISGLRSPVAFGDSFDIQ